MLYQDDLREEQVVAIWVGDYEDESDLTEYLGQPFENDFGFLLDKDDLPEFSRSFSEPRRHAHYNRPFEKTDIRELLDAFPWSDEWIDEAERLCHQNGIDSAKTVVVFPNLRYQEELCKNPQARLQFIGNLLWLGGREQWEARTEAIVDLPPFPALVRRPFGEGDLFSWEGRVHLDSWSGFATREALADEFMWFRFSELLPGDYNLHVEPLDVARSVRPTHAQARAFQHFLENQEQMLATSLQGVFAVYPSWRENYYGGEISSDGGKTFQTGWEMPDLFPPENMPEIKHLEELKQIIRPSTVHVLAREIDGFTRVGIGFDCKWDEEHGLGVLTHKGKVVDVGQADTAFTDA